MADYQFSPAFAAREVKRRSSALASLAGFAVSQDIPGVPIRSADIYGESEQFQPIETALAAHHKLMLAAIERCVTTPNGRLMMFFPPGAAKSSYASVVTPAWVMGKFPRTDIGVFSYASEIAAKHARRVRSMARDDQYFCTFRAELSKDKGAADNWQLSNGSSMIAAGLRAGITGNRYHGIIIDDPVKNREEADSEDIQNKNYDEYNDTLLTRLVPGGWVIIVQTLWSKLDIPMRILPENWDGESGRILCQDGQTWEVLCVPAKCEREIPADPLGRKPGEYLWPEWFTPGHWDKWEKNPQARRTWSALCQQKPTPKEGLQFNRGMFKWYDPDKQPSDGGEEDVLPATLHKYGASDYATLDDARGDFTEHGCAGMDWRGDLWFVDWWFGQKETDKSIDAFIHMLRRQKPVRRWANEGGPIDHAIAPAIRRAMREKQTYTYVETLPSIQSKDTKLMSFHARCSAGTVHLPLKREWAQRLVDQLCAFPAVRHDDACDVCGLLGRMIDQMAEAALPKAQQRDYVVPFTERHFAGHNVAKGPKYTS